MSVVICSPTIYNKKNDELNIYSNTNCNYNDQQEKICDIERKMNDAFYKDAVEYKKLFSILKKESKKLKCIERFLNRFHDVDKKNIKSIKDKKLNKKKRKEIYESRKIINKNRINYNKKKKSNNKSKGKNKSKKFNNNSY
tara:strand:+ start:40 stop:459 length:420 start_codon:yes stop_codon:yes gene_type:complete